jgi:hypothetical protein
VEQCWPQSPPLQLCPWLGARQDGKERTFHTHLDVCCSGQGPDEGRPALAVSKDIPKESWALTPAAAARARTSRETGYHNSEVCICRRKAQAACGWGCCLRLMTTKTQHSHQDMDSETQALLPAVGPGRLLPALGLSFPICKMMGPLHPQWQASRNSLWHCTHTQ